MYLVSTALTFTPILYYQVSYNGSLVGKQGYDYKIERKQDLPNTGCILYVVPLYSSKDHDNTDSTKQATLSIKRGAQVKVYPIEVETNTGITRKVKKGDIIGNRMAMFRFKPGLDKAILINSPAFNEVGYSKISATDALFINKPRQYVPGVQEQSYPTLVSSNEFGELTARVKKLEERTIFGTEDAETALEDSDIGTIYIQVEEDE